MSASLDAATAQSLIRQLNADRDKYLESLNRTTELLAKAIASSGGLAQSELPLPRQIPLQLTADTLRRNTFAAHEVESAPPLTHSVVTGEDDSSSESGDSLYVDVPLKSEVFGLDGLREHIRCHPFNESGQKILKGLLGNEGILRRLHLFPTDAKTSDDRSHLSHSSVYEIGQDGAPYSTLSQDQPVSRAMDIWGRIRSVNDKEGETDRAVGKIVCVREPSPLLFAALHYTMSPHFDMDEVFENLTHHDPIICRPHDPFASEHRRRRSFIFNMEYFTLVGENCEPMHWQQFDTNLAATETHIPLSRCSAVIALSLEGKAMSTVRSRNRRTNRKLRGEVFDPFSPWRVLVIQAYPDWESTVEDLDDPTRKRRHIVNGPEAFLTMLLIELRDATKRLTKVYRRVEDLIQVPPDFIFNRDTRDRLLFEDDAFTYSRRYFWATQTLGIMIQDIRDMVEAYHETFTDAVWQGTDKTIWPGEDVTSSRHAHWRKRMALLRGDMDREIQNLELLEQMNEKKIRVIHGLRDNLFSGTSVMESRRSIHTAEAAILQNNNIRILTLVTIFFLPLTFVTSVYGMTNMPPDDPFYHFGWTTAAICLPCYIIIFTLNTESGLEWWTRQVARTTELLRTCCRIFFTAFGYHPSWVKRRQTGQESDQPSAWVPSRQRVQQSDGYAINTKIPPGSLPMSPLMSARTMSNERKGFADPRAPPVSTPQSPGWVNVRFDDDGERQRRTTTGEDVVGPLTPAKTNTISFLDETADGEAGERPSMRKRGSSGNSRTLVDMFRRKKKEEEEEKPVTAGARMC